MNVILQHLKTVAALIGAVLTSVMAILPEAPLWLKITTAVVSAIAVYALPNQLTDAQRAVAVHDAVADPESPVTIAE